MSSIGLIPHVSLTPGNIPNAGDWPTLQILIAFASPPAAAAPAWTDVTQYVKNLKIDRGRQYELDQIQPGRLTLTLYDDDRRFDPTYMPGPYYPNVLPRKRVRVTATYNSTTYYLFDGYIERWPPSYEGPDATEVQITASDALLPLSKAAITGTFAQALSGARITAVVAAAQWPTSVAFTGWALGTGQLGSTAKLGVATPLTVIAAGESPVQATTWTADDQRKVLDEIRAAETTEAGVFFVDGQGRLVFHDRNHRLQTLTSTVTFTDDETVSTGASVVCYFDIAPSFDFDNGANEVTVTRTGGTPQTATDESSVDSYFRSSIDIATLHVADTDALNLALFRLRQRKDVRDALGNPQYRFDSVSINPWVQNAWAAVLARDISDRVTVKRTPATHPVGTVQQISQDCFVEGVTHTIEPPNDWTTVFQLSPVSPANDVWTLTNSKLGAANGTALAY